MGMSASQARLLSITSRLTNNEFRAQTITNSKLRLAEKSAEASSAYMDALSSQSLVYGVYSDNGEYTTQKLTPALIYDYAPLKNQYALVNPAGKMLVSSVDAKNFEDTINCPAGTDADKYNPLSAFLDKYGLLENKTYKQKVEEPNPNYDAEKKEYDTQKEAYDKYNKYVKEKEQFDKDFEAWRIRNNYSENDWATEYDKAQKAYETELAKENLHDSFVGVVGSASDPKLCYKNALNGNSTCYLHLLNTLLDFDGTFTSKEFDTSYKDDSGSVVKVNTIAAGGLMSSDATDTQRAELARISKILDQKYCDGDDDLNTMGKQNLLKDKKDAGGTPTQLDILMSDYIEKDDGTYALKTLKQKAIDMYYIIQQRLVTDAVKMKNLLISFTEGDMQKLTPDKPEAPPTPEPTWEGDVPECPLPPASTITKYEPADVSVVNDKEKAQWYTNLWYMMNGSDTVNKVKQKEIFDDEKNESYNVFVVESAEKSGKGGTYEVFDDLNLYKSSDWLQFALEHGMVTMVQAQYDNPAADSGKVPELTSEGITWKSIIYTNAADIRSQDDEVKIALAEVKYKNAVREIENKDKKFDQDLKKLDTEHTALQTEYDSIKEVISKNTERSFKAFS